MLFRGKSWIACGSEHWLRTTPPKGVYAKREAAIAMVPKERIAMSPEERDFLNLRRLPGSIDAMQTAALLGATPANIPILIAKKFLRPLGGRHIKANAPKHFSSLEVVKLADNPAQMDRMQIILTLHTRVRNGIGGAKAGKSRVAAKNSCPPDFQERNRR